MLDNRTKNIKNLKILLFRNCLMFIYWKSIAQNLEEGDHVKSTILKRMFALGSYSVITKRCGRLLVQQQQQQQHQWYSPLWMHFRSSTRRAQVHAPSLLSAIMQLPRNAEGPYLLRSPSLILICGTRGGKVELYVAIILLCPERTVVISIVCSWRWMRAVPMMRITWPSDTLIRIFN